MRTTIKRARLLGILAGAVILSSALSLHAGSFGSSGRGTAAAKFLTLAVDPRAVSLGEAFSAVAPEASALYWNPAALRQIPGRSITLMHATYIESSYFDYLAYGQRLGAKSALGVGVQYLSAGDITETDEYGNNVGNFLPSDVAATVGFARDVGGFSLGVSAKYIQSKIIDTAQAAAVDMGILSPGWMNDKLKLAVTVSNLGSRIKYEQESEDLPLAGRLGSSFRITDRWLLALDAGFPRDNQPFGAVGTEYRLPLGKSLQAAGRAGWNSRTLGDVDGLSGLSLGLGFGSKKLRVDYAFLPLGDLGIAHRLGLSFNY